MLCGEDHVFHSCLLHDIGPLLRVEIRGIQLVCHTPVPVFILLIGHGRVTSYPAFIAY